MSLINDALKRANQAKPPPPRTTAAEAPLRPVDYKRRAGWLLFALPALLLVVAALAVWLFVKAWQAERKGSMVLTTVPVAAREMRDVPHAEASQSTPPAASHPATAVSTVNREANARTGTAPHGGDAQRSGPAALASTNLQAAAAEPAKPTFPAIRLQGIFYRTTRASAILNSKMLFVGEKIAGAKVTAIDRDSVTLQWNGETKVLTLE